MAQTSAVRGSESVVRVRRPTVVAHQTYLEVVKLLRVPMFSVPTFLFPILFFAMFGLPHVNDTVGNINAGRYAMASYGTYAAMATALFSFGVTIANERSLGWNRLLRTTALSPLSYFAAKVLTALVFGFAVLIALFSFGAVVGGIEMPASTWATLVGVLIFGMLPFVALGLLLGYVSGPNSAAALANLIFLPLAFGSGLFLPLELLPEVVQDIAPYLPSYHVAQLGWQLMGFDEGSSLAAHALWVAGYTLAFLALASVAYRRDEGRTFG